MRPEGPESFRRRLYGRQDNASTAAAQVPGVQVSASCEHDWARRPELDSEVASSGGALRFRCSKCGLIGYCTVGRWLRFRGPVRPYKDQADIPSKGPAITAYGARATTGRVHPVLSKKARRR